jgi:hypothetical protein
MDENDVDEVRFLRLFAAQIGVALREREDAEKNPSGGGSDQQQQGGVGRNHPSINESVEDLYRSLCFDEPLLGHITNIPVVAAALSRQLLAPSASASSSSCALSNRLVNGVLYLCQHNQQQQQQQPSTTSSSLQQQQQEEQSPPSLSSSLSPPPPPSSFDSSSRSPATVAIAKLAFSILIGVPLECCRGSGTNGGIDTIRTLLGSYRGTPAWIGTDGAILDNDDNDKKQPDTPRDQHQGNANDDSSGQHNEQQSKDVMNGIQSSCSSDDGDDDDQKKETYDAIVEEEEVWAAESDPSDYDFGEGMLPNGHQLPLMEHYGHEEDWLDPKVLSRPNPDLTIEQASDAIATLMLLASYTLFAPIFFLSKREVVPYTSQLTQLALLLLQPGSSSLVGTTIRRSSMDSALLVPLWILRDAATYHTHDITTQQFLVTCYLEALQTLLAVDQAHLQDLRGLGNLSGISAGTSAAELCVASLVGLSALSSWCSMDRNFKAVTVDAVVDCLNDLTHVVERAIAGGTGNLNLSNILIPIVESLSGVYYDHVDKVRPIKSSIAQTLLNSGLLRQILVLAMTPEVSHTSRVPFHHALWGLCISYPATVGKYVFRYPGVTGMVRQYVVQNDGSTDPQDCVQSILWNTYCWLQCDDSASGDGSSLKIVWKKKPASSSSSKDSPGGPPSVTAQLSRDECKEASRKAWSRLCQLVQTSLQESCESSSEDGGGGDGSTSTDTTDDAEGVVREWGRLLVLARIPEVSANFCSMIDPSLLADVSRVFTNLPREETKLDSTDSIPTKNGDHDIDERKEGKTSRRHRIVTQAHKSLKEYQLHFQGAIVNGSSKMD